MAPVGRIVGVEWRPSTGELYGLGMNHTNDSATLYRINSNFYDISTIIVAQGAYRVGSLNSIAFVDASGAPIDLPDPNDARYGFDFDPTVDRIRVTTSTGLNFRVDPNDGTPVDGNLGGADGSVAGTNPDGTISGNGIVGASGAAYTNSYGQPLPPVGTAPVGVTTLYGLDDVTDSLYIQNPPNAGTTTARIVLTLGGATLDFASANGFDIARTVSVTANNAAVPTGSTGLAALTVGGSTGLYRIDLNTGVTTLVGAIGNGTRALAGLTTGG